jgi:hypothetical protein
VVKKSKIAGDVRSPNGKKRETEEPPVIRVYWDVAKSIGEVALDPQAVRPST